MSQNSRLSTVCIDCETNQNEIIDLYAINLDSGDHYRMKCKPAGKWNKEAEAVHGITYDTAMTFGDPKEEIEKFIKWLPECELVMHTLKVGYHFDWGMLVLMCLYYHEREHFALYEKAKGIISTVEMAREATKKGLFSPPRKKDKNGSMRATYSLDALCKELGIELNHHDCQSDALATENIYKYFTDLNKI